MAGHVRRRPSGSYQAIASYRDDGGKLIQLTRTCPTKAEADDALPDLLKQARQKSRPAAPMTLNELLDLWWEVQAPKLAVSTRKIDRLNLNHVRRHLGLRKLRTLTGYDIDRLYNTLKEEGLGAHAVRNIHRVLHRALNQAVRWKWMSENPVSDASPPAAPKQKGTMPGPEEFAKLVNEADRTSEWFGIYLRLTTVMAGRRGEVTALRWGDFDEAAMTIRVDEALTIGDGGVEVKGPKEESSERVLYIGPAMTKLLADYRETLAYSRDQDYMFTLDPTGVNPINPATASRMFKKVREAVGVDIRLHDLRKVASSWLVGKNVSMPTVSYRLGHSRHSTTMTADVYTRRVPGEDAEAGDILDRLVNGHPDEQSHDEEHREG